MRDERVSDERVSDTKQTRRADIAASSGVIQRGYAAGLCSGVVHRVVCFCIFASRSVVVHRLVVVHRVVWLCAPLSL